MLSADRELRYSTVCIDMVDEHADVSLIEKDMLEIYSKCRHGRYAFRNYAYLAEQYEQNVKKYRAPFIIILSVLILILMMSYSFANFTACAMNAKTDYLMMAIGIRIHQYRSTLFWDDLLRCILAVLYGCCLFLALLFGMAIFTGIPIDFSYLLSASIENVLFLVFVSIVLAGLGDIIYNKWMSAKEIVNGINQE